MGLCHAPRINEPPPLVRPHPSYALVAQVPGHAHLQAMEEGIQLLESLPPGPLAPVVVIGPYRWAPNCNWQPTGSKSLEHTKCMSYALIYKTGKSPAVVLYN